MRAARGAKMPLWTLERMLACIAALTEVRERFTIRMAFLEHSRCSSLGTECLQTTRTEMAACSDGLRAGQG